MKLIVEVDISDDKIYCSNCKFIETYWENQYDIKRCCLFNKKLERVGWTNNIFKIQNCKDSITK